MTRRPSKKLQTQNQYNQVDSTGRFGIGIAFQTDVQSAPAVTPIVPDGTVAVPNPVTVPSMYTSPPYPTPLRCDLCGVSANRQDQLETHKRGARHLRMLRLNGLPVPEPGSIDQQDKLHAYVFVCRVRLLDSSRFVSAAENENASSASEPIDYSIYRTPSGKRSLWYIKIRKEISFHD